MFLCVCVFRFNYIIYYFGGRMACGRLLILTQTNDVSDLHGGKNVSRFLHVSFMGVRFKWNRPIWVLYGKSFISSHVIYNFIAIYEQIKFIFTQYTHKFHNAKQFNRITVITSLLYHITRAEKVNALKIYQNK